MSPLHPWRPQLHYLTAGLIKSSRQKITTAVFIDAKGTWIEHCLKRQLERNMVAYIYNPHLSRGEAEGPEIQGKSLLFIFRWQSGINETLPLTLEKAGKIKGN